jgi:hypothetical protein
MARLRVGDIEIDGTHVRVGSSPTTPGVERTTLQRIASLPSAHDGSLSWLPTPASWLVGLGVVMFVVGSIRLAITSGPLDVEHIVTRGAFLLPLGLGLVLLAALKVLGAREGAARGPDAGTLDHLAQLRDVLRGAQRHTIPSLSRRLGWSESDVVRALGWLQHAGDVDEEIDMASGDFHYVLVARPHDLATRLRHLQETNRA